MSVRIIYTIVPTLPFGLADRSSSKEWKLYVEKEDRKAGWAWIPLSLPTPPPKSGRQTLAQTGAGSSLELVERK